MNPRRWMGVAAVAIVVVVAIVIVALASGDEDDNADVAEAAAGTGDVEAATSTAAPTPTPTPTPPPAPTPLPPVEVTFCDVDPITFGFPDYDEMGDQVAEFKATVAGWVLAAPSELEEHVALRERNVLGFLRVFEDADFDTARLNPVAMQRALDNFQGPPDQEARNSIDRWLGENCP